MFAIKKSCAVGAIAVIVVASVFTAGCMTTPSSNSTQTAGAGGQLPTANAGPRETVKVGTTVTLDGSRSTSPNGSTLSYNWSLSSIPKDSAAHLANQTLDRPTFTPDKVGAYVASLVVRDSAGAASTPDSTNVTVIPLEPYNTTLTVQASKTDIYLGDHAFISGKLVDADGIGIPNQTISFKTVARVLGFTTDYPLSDTKTGSNGAYTQSEPVTRHGAPSFITDVDVEIWAIYGGNELYKPATSPHIHVTIHLTSPPSS